MALSNPYEISGDRREATRLAEFMADLTNTTGDNYTLANTLSEISRNLQSFNEAFGYRWNDFSDEHKRIIVKCKKLMETSGKKKYGKI
jgi:hypothetical protein|tara:strand:+ start:2682 stop:2945 length:264 start_codon:yes stop_codon:yes gene_type:complete